MLLLIFQLVIVMHQIKLNDEPEPELDNIILVAIRKRGKLRESLRESQSIHQEDVSPSWVTRHHTLPITPNNRLRLNRI